MNKHHWVRDKQRYINGSINLQYTCSECDEKLNLNGHAPECYPAEMTAECKRVKKRVS